LQDPGLAKTWGLADEDVAFLVDRYRRPGPNNALAILVRNFAQAAIDVSDGLVGDIDKLCQVSHVGARIEAARVPLSDAAQKVLAREPDLLPTLITAGDDYGVVLAISEKSAPSFESEAQAAGARFTLLGTVTEAAKGVAAIDAKGQPISLKRKGFSHF